MALYRKYRPATFDDVIGQGHITTTLRNEIISGKVAHAYLFTGSRGTGKTTCSKILAKAVNCLDPQDGEPCLKCENCVGLEEGRILDVLEIDAASNNGVDNIRDLREEAVYTPAKCKYRVYIVDEAHMLSQGAFNALLKIMEEPPEHVIFILATTEVHKVPATILSRCQRFDFKRIESAHIAERLLTIAKKEGFSLTPDAAQLIAKAADGSARDALSLLDKCVSANDEITQQAVRDTIGIADVSYLCDIAEKVEQGDLSGVMTVISQLYAASKDMERLCAELMELYRDILVVKTVKTPSEHILSSGAQVEQLKALGEKTTIPQILSALTLLSECRDSMGRQLDPRTQLEIALLKLCTGSAETPEPVIKRAVQPQQKAKAPMTMAPPEQQKEPEGKSEPAVSQPPQQEGDGSDQIFAEWDGVLTKLAAINGALYGTLVGSRAFVRGDLVLIDTENKMFLKLIRENEQAKQSLRKAIQLQTGKNCRLGPYDKAGKPQEKKANPLEEIAKRAKENGVDITYK